MALALAKLEFPHIYPDPEARRLRAALAADCGVPAENLLAGECPLSVLSPPTGELTRHGVQGAARTRSLTSSCAAV